MQLIGHGVTFYLYDSQDGVDWQADLHKILGAHACAQRPTQYQHRGELYFLQQLGTHRWRTRNAKSAKLFIIPVCEPVAYEHSLASSHQRDCTLAGIPARCRACGLWV